MKNWSSEELLVRTRNLVAEERRVTLSLIEHLEEIQSRMLYAELGYSSLWEFATEDLGLSDGAAQRRILAMRLVLDVPEAKVSLKSGKLSLSNAAKVQSFRQAERKLGRKSDPKLLVERVETLSQKECLKALFEISPEALPRERERVVSAAEERELKLVVSAGLYEKLQRLKGLLAHALPEASYAELLEYMTEEVLTKLEKKKGISHDADTALTAAAAVKPLPAGKRVYIPRALERAVWARGKGQCEIQLNGRRCSSRYRVQTDHIVPIALGGPNELSNLRLACWHHNQQQAKEKLGC
jgi:hypothetical protein